MIKEKLQNILDTLKDFLIKNVSFIKKLSILQNYRYGNELPRKIIKFKVLAEYDIKNFYCVELYDLKNKNYICLFENNNKEVTNLSLEELEKSNNLLITLSELTQFKTKYKKIYLITKIKKDKIC